MRQRGKKSLEALSVVTDMTQRAPPLVPPVTLAPAALAVFKRTINRAPLGWFSSEQADLIGQYACCVATAERLRQMAMDPDVGVADFLSLSRLAQAEAGLALKYGTALRLTPHSRSDAKLAGRRASGERPPVDVGRFVEEMKRGEEQD